MCFALGSAIVVVVFSGLFAIAAAQEPAEELFENLGAETAVSPELDAVEMFSARPLDLRRATAAELAAIPGFSLSTARRILRLVKTIADISYDRIADSLRLSPEQAYLLRECTTLDGDAPDSRTKPRPVALLRARYAHRFQETSGISSGEYTGTEANYYQRLTISSGAYSGELLTDKDAGETSFADFVSGYASAGFGQLRLIAGDYTVSSGMGSVLWRQFGLRKGAETVSPAGQYGKGIAPYRSSLGYGFFRGGAAEYSLATGDSSALTCTGFGSHISRAASIDSSGKAISLKTDGYFRTESEISRKNALPETALGFLTEYRTISLSATLSVLHLCYGFPVASASSSAFSGSEGTLLSLATQWSPGDATFSGELARDASGSPGGRLAVAFGAGNISAAISGRFYSADFRSPFGYSFGEFSTPGNEYGFYTGVEWRGKRLRFSGYADIYGSIKPRFGMTRPTRGMDIFLENSMDFPSGTTLLLRGRIERRNDAFSTPETRTDFTVERFSLRVECSRELSKTLSLRLRAEGVRLEYHGVKPNETGIIGFAEARWQVAEWLRLGGRLAAFSTESFASARWTFEYALPGMMSNPALYGNGTRSFFYAALTPVQTLTVRFLYTATAKNGETSLGSGNDEIAGSTDSRLTLQLDAAW